MGVLFRSSEANKSKLVEHKMARDGTGVKKATENSIEIQFNYNSVRCRERIKCKPTPANLRKIAQFRENILVNIEEGTFDYAKTFPDSKRVKTFQDAVEPPTLTIKVCLDVWLAEKETQTKASSYSNYRKAVAILTPVFGHLSPITIKKVDLKNWCKTLTTNSNKTIRCKIFPLISAIQLAVDDELLETNPLAKFTFKTNEELKDDMVDPLSREESAILLANLTGQHKNLVQFALWTGLRTSELIAVHWGDVDFNRGTIMIQRAKTQVSKKDERTKTATGTREVKLLGPALSALGNQKAYTFLVGKHIFLNEKTNSPYTGDYQIWMAWKRAILKSGLRYRNPYQTRHTYASWMLSAGEPLAWISKQMGHKSITTTTKYYARFLPDSQPDAGNKAVDLFSVTL